MIVFLKNSLLSKKKKKSKSKKKNHMMKIAGKELLEKYGSELERYS